MPESLADCWPELLALAARAKEIRDHAKTDHDVKRLDDALAALARRAPSPLVGAVYAPLIAAIACGPVTVAQIGQSLDGRIATAAGHSHYINGAAGLDHLHRLRALADAVVVGAGTVAADDPQLTTRRVPGPSPLRVVIDPRRRLTGPRRVFAGPIPALRIVAAACGARPADDAGSTIAIARDAGRTAGHLPPERILAALHRRGLRAVLVEGGGRTVSAFIAAGAVDRLHVLVAPLLIGSGARGLQLPEVARIEDALRLHAGVHRLGEDVLFDCELRTASRWLEP
jgi:riboflavin-specific deaminase-like protein